MPIDKYFKGSGREVMNSMRKKYGDRAERVFYATANSKNANPGESMSAGRKALGTPRRKR